MKKALSIILCLAMLVSTVPMSVFAAPMAVTGGDTAAESFVETNAANEVTAELSADPDRTGVVFDSEEKLSEIALSGYLTSSYNSELGAAVFSPNSTVGPDGKYLGRDTNILMTGLNIKASDYAYLDVTYLATEALEKQNAGEVFFATKTLTSYTGGVSARVVESFEDGDKITYRYDFCFSDQSAAEWKGICTSIRIDPYNDDVTPYTVFEIQFVRKDAVQSIDLTGINVPDIGFEVDTDAVVPSTANYAVESLTWSPEVTTTFREETAYSVTAKVVLNDTERLFAEGETTATVNGNAATLAVDAEDSRIAYVTYEFPATGALQEISLMVGVENNGEAKIDVADGTLQLVKRFYVLSGGALPAQTDVIWSIAEGQDRRATVDENGLVTANLDTDELVVIATSKYNPAVTASIKIAISNQTPESVITYAAGTGETVTGLPENEYCKGQFTLNTTAVPLRDGYKFKGWTKELGGEIIKEDEVYVDTTYYAAWVGTVGEDFDDKASDEFTTKTNVTATKTTYTDGILSVTPNLNTTAKKKAGFFFQTPVRAFDLGIATVGTEALVIKTDVGPENFEMKVQLWVSNTNGGSNTSDTVSFYSYEPEIDNADEIYDINDYVTQDGDWYVYSLPTNLFSKWDERDVLYRVKVSFMQRDESNGTYLAFDECKFDYIKFVCGYDVPAMDIELVTPETKGDATKKEIAVQDTLFEITSVEWSPALLENAYFDSAETYTATVKVKALAGVSSFSNPPARVTINGNNAEYTRDTATTATIKYTFPETEDLGELKLVTLTLNEKATAGSATETIKIFSGDDFDLLGKVPAYKPSGSRWYGWSETENGEPLTEDINVTENASFYALYETITSFDYSNELHCSDGNTSATNGKVELADNWAVVTPSSQTANASLALSGMNLKASDYDYIEVIYDGSLEETGYDNKFDESFVPALSVTGSMGSFNAELVSAEPVIASNRVSYKYTYCIAVDERTTDITSIRLAPYAGFPAWAVTSVVLVPNEEITEAVAVTEIDAPLTWGTPDKQGAANENYEIKSVSWTGANGFNADGSFKPDSVYTATIVVKPVVGKKIIVSDATVGGNAPDSAVLGDDGTLTIKYTYPATAALLDFTLSLDDAVIDVPEGTVTLVPVFTPASSDYTIDVQSVKWEIVSNGPDGKSATIDENGVVKASYDGDVVIRATADYNPAVTAEATVYISNQVANYTVKFDPNTTSTVTNMPATAYVKYDYKLPTAAPVRNGFNFAGWVENPTDTIPVATVNISENKTFYALWVKGVNYEFLTDEAVFNNHSRVYDVSYGGPEGTYKFTCETGDPILWIGSEAGPNMFVGNDYRQIEIRVRSSKTGTFNVTSYFTSRNADGSFLAPPYATNADKFVANLSRVPVNFVAGEYQTIVFDMSQKSDWTGGIINGVRLDLPDSGEMIDVTFEVDYIRFVNYETGNIEVTGVDAPVAKKAADRDAVSADPSKYTVSKVEWDNLLYDNYYAGNTVYTANVYVKGAPGFIVSDSPAVAKINGKAADSYRYDYETSELILTYTFPETGAIENDTAHTLTLVAKDDNGEDVVEERTIFEGDSFAIGTYMPSSVPSGMRWIGWSTEENDDANALGDSVVVTEPVTYYAVYENLVEFDYSNYYHTFGTTSSAGGTLSFDTGAAYMTVGGKEHDAVLITPSMNIDASDFSYIEVYYDATLTSTHGGVKYDNKMSALAKPELKFSTVNDPASSTNKGVIVKAEKAKLGAKNYIKYTYDMTQSAAWTGKIASLYADPYNGYPNWAIGLIKLVPNNQTTKVAAIELAAPETWYAAPTAALVNEEFEIVEVKWSPSDEVFAAETAYTAKVTYKPATGYSAAESQATIAGKEATVVANSDGTFTATVKFDATEALKEVEVAISGNDMIRTAGRYLDLKATVSAVDGSDIPMTDITWSIANKDTSVTSDLAKISENGRVYPISNGVVVVTATSVYDPSVFATHEVTIENQADLKTVTFDKNTQAEVTGMPEPVQVIGAFVPETYNDIKRDGFFFLGWSVDEDALTPDKSFNITEDTTLYAKWGTGFEWSFDDSSTAMAISGTKKATYKDGIVTLTPVTTTSFTIAENNGLNTLKIATATHTTLEVRFASDMPTGVRFYLRSSNEDGTVESPWDESARQGSTDNTLYAPGEFHTVSFDLSTHANWNMQSYMRRVRFDMTESGYVGTNMIDYVRFYSAERTVKFDGNGGLIPLYGGEVTSFKETYNTGSIALPEEPSREGYEFIGWAKATEDYNKLYNGSFTVTDNVTLYAIWTPAAVLDETTVSADGAEVTVNEDGTVTITSEDVTTPTVAVADSVDVSENSAVVVKVDGTYASTENGEITLNFKDENGEDQSITITEEGVSGEALVVDLADYGITGTITDVELVLPTGVIEELTIEEVTFATPEIADVLAGNVKTESAPSKPNDDNSSSRPGLNTGNLYPSVGGGTISENTTSQSKTPTDKVVVVPARPKDESTENNNNTQQPGTTTPAVESKFKLSQTYDGRFVDVAKTAWYYGDVEKSFRLGLMNGKSDTTFVPEGTVTLAEAITVAARMHAIYNNVTVPTSGTGNLWYTPYVTYATSKAIISAGQFTDYTALATREQVAVMFVKALPASWYKAINLFNTIPDVPASNANFAAIQRLYNAGILTGVDASYNFKPNDNIKRSELSAIINRVALTESRLRVVTEDEKKSIAKTFYADEIAGLKTNNITLEVKDGLAGGMPTKADPMISNLNDLVGGVVDASKYKTVTVVAKITAPAGTSSQMFFSPDGAPLSEANSVRTTWSAPNASGMSTVTFNLGANAAWKGNITTLRFDPFDLIQEFYIESITLNA